MTGLTMGLTHSRAAFALTRFVPADVDEVAEALSRVPHVPSSYRPPAPLDTFGYDEYRDIRFRAAQSVWRKKRNEQALGISLQFFLASFLYHDPVDVYVVESGEARLVEPRRDLFDFGLSNDRVPQLGNFAFSGFRLHGPMKQPDVDDEIAAFMVQVTFAVWAAITAMVCRHEGWPSTPSRSKEEFPRFVKFWIEQPGNLSTIRLHALLDSPSVTGAYHFEIRPGVSTVFDIDAKLFPRRDIDRGGLAPLTSMFLSDSRSVQNFRDFRPAVHDNDGLAIHTADGQHIWRPLLNSSTLQMSSYPLENPRGFGLIQRKRKFEDFHDLEAKYELRPSAWVEPRRDWGSGSIELLEVPIGAEWADNIVAYWRPREPMRAGRPVEFSYRLYWSDNSPNAVGRIIGTRVGLSGNRILFAVGYEGVAEATSAMVTTTTGETSSPILQANPHTGGIRCVFTFDPKDQTSADLELSLVMGKNSDARTASNAEVWSYRWVR